MRGGASAGTAAGVPVPRAGTARCESLFASGWCCLAVLVLGTDRDGVSLHASDGTAGLLTALALVLRALTIDSAGGSVDVRADLLRGARSCSPPALAALSVACRPSPQTGGSSRALYARWWRAGAGIVLPDCRVVWRSLPARLCRVCVHTRVYTHMSAPGTWFAAALLL